MEGIKGLDLLLRLNSTCKYPALKIDFREAAEPVIEEALFRFNRTFDKIAKAQHATDKKANTDRNLDFLQSYT